MNLDTIPHIHRYVGNDSIPGFSECECGLTMSVVGGIVTIGGYDD